LNVRKHRKPRVIKTSLAVASGPPTARNFKEIKMTQNEFNALVSQDIQARVAAAQARYEAELDNEYFEAGMTPGEQAYWDAVEGAAQ